MNSNDLKKFYCQKGKNKGNRHEAGKWAKLRDESFYKVMVKNCVHCGCKMYEEIFK